jgi:hypothetical protein
MAACLVAATALVGWWRLAEQKMPAAIAGLVALLIGYATLVRGNAVFATVPLALALAGWPGLRHRWQRGLAMLAGVVAVLAAGPLINQRLLGAEATHTDRALLVYDIAGIAHLGGLATMPGIAADGWREAERRGCYTPFFWNPYGEPAQCGWIADRLAFSAGDGPSLGRTWLGLILQHPLAYAEHRLGHFNSNQRFLVGWGERDAIPPTEPEPNAYGLGARSNAIGRGLIALARLAVLTPLGWPIVWLTAGIGLLAALRTTSAAGRLAQALALSAVAMSASYAVVSLASDLRYHLWSMVAVALALVIGWPAVTPRLRMTAIVLPVLAISALALTARFVAPPVTMPLPVAIVPPGLH